MTYPVSEHERETTSDEDAKPVVFAGWVKLANTVHTVMVFTCFKHNKHMCSKADNIPTNYNIVICLAVLSSWVFKIISIHKTITVSECWSCSDQMKLKC